MIIMLIISFFLDGLLSNLLVFSNYLYPLCSLLSLVIICPLFKKRQVNKYYLFSMIIGLLYDIVYTNTLFLNFILFFLIAILIRMIYNLVSNNYLSLIIISFFIIVLYRITIYLVLFVVNYKLLNINILLQSVYSSFIINFIYVSLFYFIFKKS